MQTRWIVDPLTGCWNWSMFCNRKRGGYGQAWNPKRKRLEPAHRYIYELYRGEIPAKMHLDHLCRNPRCVNPDHLQPVTNFENARRGNRTQLTLRQISEIRERYTGRFGEQTELAKIYGVSSAHIGRIVANKHWATKKVAESVKAGWIKEELG